MAILCLVPFAYVSQSHAQSSSVSFSDVDKNGENTDVNSVGAGRFRQGNVDDLIYIDEDERLQMRQSTGSARSWQSSYQISDQYSYKKVWVVDVNNDGFDDLVSVNNGNQVYVLMASKNQWFFNGPAVYTFGLSEGAKGSSSSTVINDMDFGDFNGDGSVDIAVLATVSSSSVGGSGGEGPANVTYYNQGYYSIALNNGAGGFSAPGMKQTGSLSQGTNAFIFTAFFSGRVTAGDFNGDSKMDAAFCYHTNSSFSVPYSYIFPGVGDGSLDFNAAVSSGHRGCQDVTAVLPNGPFENVITSTKQATFIFVDNSDSYAQVYDGQWNLKSETKMENTPRGPVGPFTDFNFDGSADMVFTNGKSSLVMVGWNWADTSDRKITNKTSMILGTDIQTSDVGDFDGDGKPDVIGGYDEDINVYYNNTAE